MISFTATQLDSWIAAYAFPLVRILGFAASTPIWGASILPRRVRLLLGLAITIAVAPTLPTMPTVAPGSLAGLWIMTIQLLLGLAMGFAAKVVFSAIDLAGEFIGAQMGLGFATFYDPNNASQSPVITEFINLLALLLFLSLNGHLLFIAALAESFQLIPVSAQLFSHSSWLNLVNLAGQIFSLELLLSLPVLVALLITNFALAILTRAAPQLNIFSLGFPLTLLGGFIAMMICMNYLASPLQTLFEIALNAMLGFIKN